MKNIPTKRKSVKLIMVFSFLLLASNSFAKNNIPVKKVNLIPNSNVEVSNIACTKEKGLIKKIYIVDLNSDFGSVEKTYKASNGTFKYSSPEASISGMIVQIVESDGNLLRHLYHPQFLVPSEGGSSNLGGSYNFLSYQTKLIQKIVVSTDFEESLDVRPEQEGKSRLEVSFLTDSGDTVVEAFDGSSCTGDIARMIGY